MKSETKFFSKQIYLSNIKRLWPIWTLATIGGIMIAVSGWINLAKRHMSNPETLNKYVAQDLCYDALSLSIPVVAFLLAGILGIGIWSYLYSKRGVDFMHSLPMGRRKLFITNTLSLYTMMVVPFLPALLIYILASVRYGIFIGLAALWILLAILAECLVFATLEVFASAISGTVVSQICMYIFVNFFAIGAYYTIFSFGRQFLYGVTESELSPIIGFFSPIEFFLSEINTTLTYSDVMTSCELHGMQYFAVYALTSIILLIICIFIYGRRKSESTMEFIAFKSIKTILVYVCTIIAAMAFAKTLYSIFSTNYSETVSLVPMLVCLAIGIVISFFVALMVVNKTTKVLIPANIRNCAILIAVMVVATVVASMDIGGIATTIPDVDEVANLRVTVGPDNFYITADDKELLKTMEEMQQLIIDAGPRNGIAWEGKESTNISFEYILNSGKKIGRHYYIPITKENLENSDSLEAKLTEYVNNPLFYKNKCYIGVERADYTYASLTGWIDNENQSVSASDDVPYDKLKDLRDAVEADFYDGNIPAASIFYDYEGTYLYVEIEIEDYRRYINADEKEEYNVSYASDWGYGSRVSIKYNPAMKHLTQYFIDNHLAEEYLKYINQ